MSSQDKIHNTKEIDDLISAEIPEDDPILQDLVIKWIIHNPCGEHKQEAPCMANKNGKMKCRFDFPKPFKDFTSFVEDEKAYYQCCYDPRMDLISPDFLHHSDVYRESW